MDKPNLDYIKQLADGDTAFEQQFISILKEEFPKEKEVYLKAIVERDWYEASQIVHKLKHKFNILSMENAYALAVDFEEELKNSNEQGNTDFVQVLDLMDSFIKNI